MKQLGSNIDPRIKKLLRGEKAPNMTYKVRMDVKQDNYILYFFIYELTDMTVNLFF